MGKESKQKVVYLGKGAYVITIVTPPMYIRGESGLMARAPEGLASEHIEFKPRPGVEDSPFMAPYEFVADPKSPLMGNGRYELVRAVIEGGKDADGVEHTPCPLWADRSIWTEDSARQKAFDAEVAAGSRDRKALIRELSILRGEDLTKTQADVEANRFLIPEIRRMCDRIEISKEKENAK